MDWYILRKLNEKPEIIKETCFEGMIRKGYCNTQITVRFKNIPWESLRQENLF